MSEMTDKLLDSVKKIFSLDEWGFVISSHLSNGTIFDSRYCRVKFELSLFNYYPLHETVIYYGRLHAPDNEKHILWNGEQCLCWHSNIHVVLAFIEGFSAQELADDRNGDIWLSIVKPFKVNHPRTDHFGYPLRLQAKIWEHYGENLFSVFDLSKPEIWEKYSKFSTEYTKAVNKRMNLSDDVDRIC